MSTTLTIYGDNKGHEINVRTFRIQKIIGVQIENRTIKAAAKVTSNKKYYHDTIELLQLHTNSHLSMYQSSI